MTRTTENLDLILFGWIDALRRRDPEAVARHLAEDVVWQGVRPDLRCADRTEVLDNIRQGGEHRHHVQGLELLAENEHVLLGIRLPDVTELFGEPFDGEIFDVFAIRDEVIVRIDEFTTKDAALAAMRSGAPPTRRPPGSTVERSQTPATTGMPSAASGPPPEPAAAVDALVPFVHVGDVERSIAFYALLGFEVRDTYEHDGRPVWAALRCADAQLMLAAASTPIDAAQQAVLFYLYTPDLPALCEHLLAHHAHPGPILDGTPGPKQELRLDDPDGYCLMIAQRENNDA